MTFLSLCNGKDILNIEKAIPIPLEKLFDFPNHPFQVNDDKEMENMVETVKTGGIIMPLVVRQRDDGNYEIISGHRRKRACEIAGRTEIKAIVREMTDEEAANVRKAFGSRRSQRGRDWAESLHVEGEAAPEEKEYTVDEIIAEVKSWNQEHSDGSPEDKEPGDDA